MSKRTDINFTQERTLTVERVACYATVAGLTLIVGFLSALRFVPFQDLPNHRMALALDQALRAGHRPAEFLLPDVLVLGYSLYRWMAWLLERFMSVDAALRVMVIAGAIGIPLSVMRLASACRVSVAWAGLLALPLALSWPVRLGLLPYCIGASLAIVTVAAGVRVCRRAGFCEATELAVTSFACYLAHPLAFVLAACAVAVAWWTLTERDARTTALLAACGLPTALALLHDLRLHAFARVAGTEAAWPDVPLAWRRVTTAMAHVVTRSFGIPDLRSLVATAPLLAVLAVCAVRAVRRSPLTPDREERFLLAAAGLLGVGSIVVPSSNGIAYEVGQRIPLVGMALLVIVAAAHVAKWKRAAAAVPFVAVTLALVAGIADVTASAAKVERIVGAEPPRSLSGKYMTARLADCEADEHAPLFGVYDPARHLWAYALSIDGSTPYVFAYTRYLPVWFREGALESVHVTEWVINSDLQRADVATCDRLNRQRARVALVMAGSGTEGVLLHGDPAAVRRFRLKWPDAAGAFDLVAPGIARIRRASVSSEEKSRPL